MIKKTVILFMLFFLCNLFAQEQKSSEVKNKEIYTSIENLSDDIKFANRLDNIEDRIKKQVSKNVLLELSDGISYTVVSSTKSTYENCIKCSRPRDPHNCPAKYLIEGRKYAMERWSTNYTLDENSFYF